MLTSLQLSPRVAVGSHVPALLFGGRRRRHRNRRLPFLLLSSLALTLVHGQSSTLISFGDDSTVGAHEASGIPVLQCGTLAVCINGCPSNFYRVTTEAAGTDITASTCGEANFRQRIYVWSGSGDVCSTFECTASNYKGCSPTDDTFVDDDTVQAGASVTWTPIAGAEYYLQVVGDDFSQTGRYTLRVSSATLSLTGERVEVCRAPTSAPTKAPTGCADTAFWLYDPATDAPVRKIRNNTATCLPNPYNVEIRPCGDVGGPLDKPVQIRLADAATGQIVHKSPWQRKAPFLLFDSPNAEREGDVLPSDEALPNGVYRISAKGAPGPWGRLQFTQDCPCRPGKGKKGKKGCMK